MDALTNPSHLGLAQFTTTNNETLSLMCSNIKAKGIEVFTVALAVDSPEGSNILDNCASDKGHLLRCEATPLRLATAFSGIAQSLSVTRLVK